MRFGAHVKVIACDGVCMLGNTENGCIIGIDDDARALCERLCNGDIDSAELNKMDSFLRGRLEARGFLSKRQRGKGWNPCIFTLRRTAIYPVGVAIRLKKIETGKEIFRCKNSRLP